MIESAGRAVQAGQAWVSGGRVVRVLAATPSHVLIRDAYGRRREVPEEDLRRGFAPAGSRARRGAVGVLACRALADIDPA
ncbi:MAG: hypothetical protein MUC84_02880 [Solirubrobacteraceae bacterium]|jgi:hypothetical protein|nr:hypothetical protein [Solirubrobacteraceae bacterium]